MNKHLEHVEYCRISTGDEGLIFRIDSWEDFKHLIKGIRERADFTQTELANYLETNQATISQWEQGLVTPTLTTLLKIAAFIQTPILLSADILGK